MNKQIPRPTLVQSQLLHPDGTARRGEKVDFVVIASTDFREDHRGRIVGTTSTWTNATGLWRVCLLPWPAYEARENTVVEVREGGQTSGFMQVPETNTEQWMRDLLVDPPPPAPWRPVPHLAQLPDVDRDSVEQAPDGAVLVKRSGKWVAETPTFGKERLAELRDVDESVAWATALEDQLTYLGSTRGWGVNKPKPKSIHAEFSYDDTDPNAVWITVSTFNTAKTLAIYWGDDTAETPVPTPEMYDHTYAAPGTYWISVYYTDNSETVDFRDITIPKPAGDAREQH